MLLLQLCWRYAPSVLFMGSELELLLRLLLLLLLLLRKRLRLLHRPGASATGALELPPANI